MQFFTSIRKKKGAGIRYYGNGRLISISWSLLERRRKQLWHLPPSTKPPIDCNLCEASRTGSPFLLTILTNRLKAMFGSEVKERDDNVKFTSKLTARSWTKMKAVFIMRLVLDTRTDDTDKLSGDYDFRPDENWSVWNHSGPCFGNVAFSNSAPSIMVFCLTKTISFWSAITFPLHAVTESAAENCGGINSVIVGITK